MGDNVTLDRIDFEKLKQQASQARAEHTRQYGAAFGAAGRRIVPQRMTALICNHHVIAILAILVMSFGVKIFFLSAPTAEANAHMKDLPITAAQHTDGSLTEIGQPPYP